MDKKKITALAVSGLVFLSTIFLPGYMKIRRLTRQNMDLEKQVEEIRQANRRLRDEQEKLRNDPLYLEKVAREKLGVARKGEVVFKVVPSQ